jgi:hypothetical protein
MAGTLIQTSEAPGEGGRKSKRRLAEALYAQGIENTPIQHWAQGLGRMAQAAMGGYQMHQLDEQDRERDRQQTALLLGAPGLQPGNVPTANISQLSGANAARPEVPATNSPQRIYSQDQLNPIDVASVGGPRPGGPVMPSSKVWGDKEAEAAGLYEPSAVSSVNRTAPAMAQGGPAVPVQAAAGIPADQAMYIRRLIENPSTRAHGVALLQQFQTQAAAANKPTDEIREFEYAERNPRFKDYKTDLKRAGAISNTVNVDQKGENEFSKEGGKLQAKRFNELAEAGPAAKQLISDIETLRTLGAQIGTGKGAALMAQFGPYANAIGVDLKGLDEVQAYEAIISRVAPTLRVPGTGAQSDFELKTFLKALPSLGNTPGGNEIGSQVLQGVQENKLRAAEIGSLALSGQISRTEAEKRLRELPDPMQGYRDFIKRTKPAAAKAQTDIRAKYGLE